MKPKTKSLRSNFGWALYGNAVFQASQWLTLVVIAKLLEVTDVGNYALALAICTPITTFAGLRLRQVQVTDARDENRFSHLLALQFVMSTLAVLLIAGIAMILDYSTEMKAVIVVVAKRAFRCWRRNSSRPSAASSADARPKPLSKQCTSRASWRSLRFTSSRRFGR